MSTHARRIIAAPVRTASETWDVITSLLSVEGTKARSELEKIEGVAASLIADETPRSAPIVVAGGGPRVQIYCLYGEDAVIGDDRNEDALVESPTDGAWTIHLPCSPEDLSWMKETLEELSAQAFVYDAKDAPDVQGTDARQQPLAKLEVNRKEFNRP